MQAMSGLTTRVDTVARSARGVAPSGAAGVSAAGRPARIGRGLAGLLALAMGMLATPARAQTAPAVAAPPPGPAPVEIVGRPWAGERRSSAVPSLPIAPRTTPAASWAVSGGSSLRTTLQDWSDKAGWVLQWRIDGDFEAQAGAVWRGEFREAIRGLFSAIGTEHGLGVQMMTGNAPPILIVQRVSPAGVTP